MTLHTSTIHTHLKITLCLKKRPTFDLLYPDIPNPITTIFGRRVTKQVRNQVMPYFPSHLSSASALPFETGNPEIVSLHLNMLCCFANEHTKHI